MNAIAVARFLFLWVIALPCYSDTVTTGIVYHPDYLLHDPGMSHPEGPARLEAIMSQLKRQGLLDVLINIAPEPAEKRWLHEVHTEEYLQRLEQTANQARSYLDQDTVLSKESFRVAKLAAGGVLKAVDAIMAGRIENAFVALRPPGHHAFANRGSGFCLINNVAVAVRYVQEEYELKRVLIVDWDVHHGNGTQDIFYADPSVFYFSTHQWPYYPGTGASTETGSGAGVGATLNVPLPVGSGDVEVIQAYKDKLVPAAEAFRPQFVFISAGFDAHRDDPLAGLKLTEAGYRELTQIVNDIAQRFANGRLVSVLEGGYNLDALARSVEDHVRELAGK